MGEFNVEKDWSEKEKWKKGQAHFKCDLCQILVGHTFDTVGETANEDDVYDHIDSICDADKVYDGHAIIEPEDPETKPNDWKIVKQARRISVPSTFDDGNPTQ